MRGKVLLKKKKTILKLLSFSKKDQKTKLNKYKSKTNKGLINNELEYVNRFLIYYLIGEIKLKLNEKQS